MIQKVIEGTKYVLPGLIISIIISIISQGLALFVPTLGAALIAIFLGILLGNTLLNKPILSTGTKFSEKSLLEFSIVLNGLILDFQIIKQVGFTGFTFILFQMIMTIVAAYWIGRYLKFGKKFSLLMGAGNAVCGSSAIGTVAPVIDADEKDKGLSITIVNVTGTLLMVTLPILTAFLYKHETVQTSALIGGTVQSIGQVIASAKLVNDDVANLSIVFKLMRVLLIIGVALIFGKMNFEEGQSLFAKPSVKHEKTKSSAGVPWFIVGFFLLFLLRSFVSLPEFMVTSAQAVSNQFEIAALAAIGLRVKFSDIVKEGPKTLLYGLLVGGTQILLAIAFIFWLF